MHSNFVHLHLHTQYSLLDGACRLRPLMELARKFKLPALAMTDHGNMFGAIEFYIEALNYGIKPIIGCEVYIAPQSRFDKSAFGIKDAAYHLTLLAKDETGYGNLMKLVSTGYLEGFYYRPRIDKELLAQNSKGLICLSGCLKGELSHLILTSQNDSAKKLIDEFQGIFGKENFFLEVMSNGIPEQKKVNDTLVNLSKESDLRLVATNDVHYLSQENASAHEALLCIQTQTTLNDPKRMKFSTDDFYFKSPARMLEEFSGIEQAVKNTVEVAQMCNLELDFKSSHLPRFTPPEGRECKPFLRELCDEGLKLRYSSDDEPAKQRLVYELDTIEKLGFTSYFLIVWDLIRYAKEQNIPVGPGRGSAAGSIVSYSLGITDIDPIKYGLLFERFLNPERITLPDIDIDFCYERRGEVIDYVVHKYSKDNVAQIITFGTMAARGVLRDVGRVMELPYGEVDRIAKLVPADLHITLDGALEKEPQLKEAYENSDEIRRLLDTSMALEGLSRHASTHAAGVVISEKPLVNYVPLFKTSDGQITTGYAMSSLEKIGLLKMDFLGLRTLTVIEETVKLVRERLDSEFDIEKISLEDKKTFELLSNAQTIGIFQLESSGMRDLLKKMQPTDFEDITALLALYRPGPIGSGMLDDFIHRKHGKTPVKYDHPILESVLKETYGIIVFQEQVMQIASLMAGFSLAQADLLRRAMGKKNPEVMEKQRISFIEGAISKKVRRDIAEKVFSFVEYFSGYGFNKSHSASYAMISYRTAFLKSNYPVEFISALLTSEKDNTNKVVQYIKEAERMGIKLLEPDVNESFAEFVPLNNHFHPGGGTPGVEVGLEKSAIRFGLASIKNVGTLAIESVVQTRQKKGKFSSIFDFTERVDLRLVNRKVVESFIKCGAFDKLGFRRSQLMSVLDKALEAAGSLQKDRLRGQFSFFDTFEDDQDFRGSFQQIPNIAEWPENQILTFEKELLGFYISGHPLAQFERILKTYATTTTTGLFHLQDGENISVGGIIVRVKNTFTKKKNERMAILTMEDLEGMAEVLVFPEAYKRSYLNIAINVPVFIRGRVNFKDEDPKIIANEIVPIEGIQKRWTKAVKIRLIAMGFEEETLGVMKDALSRHPGRIPVYINFRLPDGSVSEMMIGKDLSVEPTEELVNDIERVVGEGAVSFVV